MNSFSLTPDLDKLRNPFPYRPQALSKPFQQMADEIDPSCSEPLVGVDIAVRSKELPRRWKLCAQLRKAEAYAVDPLTRVFSEASVYFLQLGNIQYSLALTAFVLLHCDTFREPEPFASHRLKDMFMVTKALSYTAQAPVPPPSRNGALATRIAKFLSEKKQITIGQTMLRIILHYSVMTHSEQSLLYQHARDLLTEVEDLPGRKDENALIDAFVKNPSGQGEECFFKTVVLEPLQTLAGFALEIMNTEFGK